ncbi:MAG: cbb3-type cytochrome oxidase assembly protein CcoS [Chitinophagaceae bacterium]|nr:MAG: cbb3-type cytochrome oxidase assembly protein CcoS [Chitinophagaceae bacterium]
MSVLFILIAISMVIAGAFLFFFFWNVRSGQYDDDYTPSVRMLFDDELVQAKVEKPTGKSPKAKRRLFKF